MTIMKGARRKAIGGVVETSVGLWSLRSLSQTATSTRRGEPPLKMFDLPEGGGSPWVGRRPRPTHSGVEESKTLMQAFGGYAALLAAPVWVLEQ